MTFVSTAITQQRLMLSSLNFTHWCTNECSLTPPNCNVIPSNNYELLTKMSELFRVRGKVC